MKQTFIVGIDTDHTDFNDWIDEHDKQIRADAIEECHKAICDYMYSNNIHLFKISKDESDTPVFPYKVADDICEQLKESKE